MNFVFALARKAGRPRTERCWRGHDRKFHSNSHRQCLKCRSIREIEFRKAAREGYKYNAKKVAV